MWDKKCVVKSVINAATGMVTNNLKKYLQTTPKESHYVEEPFWKRLWTCRQTDYWMNEWTKRTFNRFATKGTLHTILCRDNVMLCDSYFVQLIHIRSHITSHTLTMWRNVTCIMSNTQTRHITSHDNVIQCDLYHIQLLNSHVTIHHMTMWCNVTCITSNSYTVKLHYITCLNNISSRTTSTDLTCRWELFY